MTGKIIARWVKAAVFVGLALGLMRTPANALIITYGYQTSFASNADYTANFSTFDPLIQTAVNTVASLYSDPITINILFNGGNLGGGAGSLAAIGSTSYSDWTTLLSNDLVANPTNTTLQTAVSHLGDGNDVSGKYGVVATTSNYKALGQSLNTYFDSSGNFVVGGGYDGVITITPDNTSVATIEHEINEILGGGGQGSQLTSSNDNPANGYGPLDLYRYSAPGTPSYDNSTSITSYLSVDGGVTNIANFNQNGIGDYSDFTSSPCNIQSWQVCTGAPNYTTSSPEYQMMLAIGYDPVTVPLPPTLSFFVAGLGFLGLLGWWRKWKAAALEPA